MRHVSYWLFIFLFLYACVERFDLPDGSATRVIVVDGLVTAGAGPHTVHLFYSTQAGEDLDDPTPVGGAFMEIVNHLGNVFPMTEGSAGEYTASFTGIVGHSYKLRFVTNDGKAYESSFQRLMSAG